MTTFRVWAPEARSVELETGGDRHACRPAGGGWWELDLPEAGPGTDYAYRVDGSGPFPDPRSAQQPFGVHGPSRVVDHEAFRWTDSSFAAVPLERAVLYELHVGTFSPDGTFEGAIARLDHLVALGVTHLELMPVAAFSGERGWGYDAVDLFAPHEAYGGPDGLKRLADACHARGLGIVLDVVYNHLGPDGNHLGRFGPYFSRRYLTPWGDAVNFDAGGADEVRAFVIDNARMWVRDYHVDGLRLDAVHELFDRSAVHVLEELAGALHDLAGELRRPVCVIAESDLNDPRLVRDVADGGLGLDAQWNDDARHALHVALTGEATTFTAQYAGLEDVAASLRRVFVFDGRYSPFRDRRHGRAVPPDVPATRFVTFLQNHDQVGNRLHGERLGHLVSPEAAMAGAAVVLLGPFVPLLFMGEEWSASAPFRYFTDHADARLADAVREGRRREFGLAVGDPEAVPDPQDVATFAASRLDWTELDREPHARVLRWYRELVAYRHAHPELTNGERPDVRFDAAACWLAFERAGITVAVNLSPEAHRVPLPADGWLELASGEDVTLGDRQVALPAWGVGVVRAAAPGDPAT